MRAATLVGVLVLAACGEGAPLATSDRGAADAPPAALLDGGAADRLSFGDGARTDLGAPGDGAAAAPFKHLVILGWDGVQRQHFKQCFNKKLAECPNGVPNYAALTGGKVLELTVTSAATCTKPGWVELLTGYDATRLGIADNKVFKPVPAGYSALEKLQARFGAERAVTLFLAGKTSHVGGSCATSPKEPWCQVKKNLDTFENGLGENAAVGEQALALLEQHKGAERIFAFFHFWDPDHTGHAEGEASAAYSKKILDDDAWLGKIVAKLEALGLYQQTLIYVVTDHGFDEGLKSHANAPFGVMGTNDPAVIRSGDRKDVAPTILKRFGVSLDAAGDIPAVDGTPLDAIPSGCLAAGQAFVAYAGAPSCCAGLKVVSLDKVGSSGQCVAATGAIDGSGYCAKCGNGSCEAPENKCNCAADCR